METFHPVALRSAASTSCAPHSAVVQKAACSASQQLRAHAVASPLLPVGAPGRPPCSRKPSTSKDGERIYGLQHLIAAYPSHPAHPDVFLLSAKQYHDLQAQDLALNTPESVLFPWLHGADQRGTQQACYFGHADRPCKTPRFRALTTVSCDSDRVLMEGHPSRTASLGSKSFLSSSSISSSASSSSGSSSSSISSFDFSDLATPASPPTRGGPKRPAQLLSTFMPEELLLATTPPTFQDVCVPSQVNLRNFRLQATKLASVSDIVVYSAAGLASPELLPVAERFLAAQRELRQRRLRDADAADELVEYRVFVVADAFDVFERFFPDLVGVTLNGFPRHRVDFFEREREEMRLLTQASPIADGVWLGNSQDVPLPRDGRSDLSDLQALAAALEYPQPGGGAGSQPRARMASSDSSSSLGRDEMEDGNPLGFAVCVEAHDQAYMAPPETLKSYEDVLDRSYAALKPDGRLDPTQIVHLECISTGQACVQPGSAISFVENLVHLVMWIRRQAKPSSIPQPPSPTSSFPCNPIRGRKARAALAAAQQARRPRNVLIHTEDGYTDTSVLALAYIMYDRACSLPQAYLALQNDCQRSFFVYPADVMLLSRVEARLQAVVAEERRSAVAAMDVDVEPAAAASGLLRGRFGRSSSPACQPRPIAVPQLPSHTEKMLAAPFFYNERFDGHFPSRILPFLYLGNLNHATNALMLKELGITHVVSIGETALIPPRSPCESPEGVPTHLKARMPTNSLWLEATMGNMEVLDLRGIADDGIDPIRGYIEQASDFIEAARAKGGKVLVHCRVGVSRSASLVIAYVMKHLEMDLQSAYLLVRSRRLNILIQPTILFMWSLQWYEAKLNEQRRAEGKRLLGPRLTWGFLAREMCELNARYLNC